MLDEVCQYLIKEESIAVDLECENNLHHFGSYISLIQISTSNKNYIFDILKLKELRPLIEVMHDSSIQKIFHDDHYGIHYKLSPFHVNPDDAISFKFESPISLNLGLKKTINSIKKELNL